MEQEITQLRLETDRLLLRDFTLEDAEQIYRNMNNIEVSRNLSKVPYPYTREDAISFMKGKMSKEGPSSRKDFALAIMVKDSNTFVGGIGLHDVDYEARKATLGYWLGQSFWGNGYATEAATRIRDFAFQDLDLHSLDVEAWVENAGSNNVIRKIGGQFQKRDLESRRPLSTGVLVDSNVYKIFREDL